MRAHLGPPRELTVRRRETAHHRAMRLLWSWLTIVLCGFALIWLLTPATRNAGWGPWVAKVIVMGAAVAIGVQEIAGPHKARFSVTMLLAWTAMLALVVWR
jgi:FtsH-binding integral membrane protein